MKKSLTLLVLLCAFFFNCTKTRFENKTSAATLVGKWQVMAGYSAIYNASDFKWHSIAPANAAVYQFNADSSFVINGLSERCFPATYKQVDSIVFMNFKCSMRDSIIVQKLTVDSLFIKSYNFEGYILNKLVPIR